MVKPNTDKLLNKYFSFFTFFTLFTHISTLSTLTPHGSVASSSVCSMTWLMVSLSERISARFLVPSTLRRVVAANRRVEWLVKGGKIMLFYWQCYDLKIRLGFYHFENIK